MKYLHFSYDMQISYSIDVSRCHFTIKCIPQNNIRQQIENLTLSVSPPVAYQWGEDGFRNRKIYGVNEEEHREFHFHIEGDARTGLGEYEEEADESLAMVFAHPYGLNRAGDAIRKFVREEIADTFQTDGLDMRCTKEGCHQGTDYERAICIMHLLYQHFSYQSGSTTITTSAEEAFVQGYGVCQDYAHILIAMLHLTGIAARYVTGFIMGEGQSHAWVEILDHGRWIGIDPTHDRAVNDEYIKIGHGRDASDCTINRGIMHGGGLHTQDVAVCVTEYR